MVYLTNKQSVWDNTVKDLLGCPTIAPSSCHWTDQVLVNFNARSTFGTPGLLIHRSKWQIILLRLFFFRMREKFRFGKGFNVRDINTENGVSEIFKCFNQGVHTFRRIYRCGCSLNVKPVSKDAYGGQGKIQLPVSPKNLSGLVKIRWAPSRHKLYRFTPPGLPCRYHCSQTRVSGLFIILWPPITTESDRRKYICLSLTGNCVFDDRLWRLFATVTDSVSWAPLARSKCTSITEFLHHRDGVEHHLPQWL